MSDQSKYCATTPIEIEKPTISKPYPIAGGPKAVGIVLQEGLKHMNAKKCATTLLTVNQVKGFDCPSCAWPDPKAGDRSRVAEYCENGAKAIIEEATEARANPAFFAQHSVIEMSHWSDYKIGKSGRITHPMILNPGETHYSPISWTEAFSRIASHLNNLKDPNEAIFYTSGRASNEAAFLYQLFARQYGTNNLPDCSNMCHESSGVALTETLGIGKGSVKLEDFYVADLIIIVGQNPGTNHPRMLSALQIAKKNKAKIIAVNPLQETGLKKFKNPQNLKGWIGPATNISDLFLQVKVGGDIALTKSIMRLLLQEEDKNPGTIFDQQFIDEKTHGFDAFIADLRSHSAEALAEASGVAFDLVRRATEQIIKSERIIICWAMGVTQHKNSVQIIRELVNLLLLKGSIGKPGAGTCPVRGHSNVQGDRTVGINHHLPKALGEKMANLFHFDPPKESGHDVVHAIQAMGEGKAKVFFALGGNFLSASPDTEYTAKSLQQCDLTVQVSTKPNRSHLIHGKTAIILPCLGRTEIDQQKGGKQFVSVENSMGIVHNSIGQIEPASEHLLSEPAIVARLAKATLKSNKPDWEWLIEDYDRIRDLIEKCVAGFDNYNKRVRREGGFYLPNCAREQNFETSTGKANFTINPLLTLEVKAEEFIMMTTRSHDQFNTTIYGLDDRYRGVKNGRRVVFMNPKDCQNKGLKQGDYVDLKSHYEGVERIAPHFMVVEYDIPEKCVGTYFPEANVLVPVNSYAERSITPTSKSIIITIEKSTT